MAEYRTSKPTFWTDDYISVLPANGKLLYLFLMNNSFGMDNNLGITQASTQMIACIVGFDASEVETLLQRFEADGKIARDGNKILLINFIRHQFSKSPKIESMLKTEYAKQASDILRHTLSIHYPDIFGKADTLSIPYPYPIDTLSIQKEQGTGNREQEIIIKQEEKEEKEADAYSAFAAEAAQQQKPISSKPPKAKQADCPYAEIVALYHQTLPNRPRVKDLTPTRKKNIRHLWQTHLTSLERWKKYFEFISKSEFLTGRKVSEGHNPKIFNLAWYTKYDNFVKICEQTYHETREDDSNGNERRNCEI